MPPIDGWTLIARIAANNALFTAATGVADTTAFLLLRNQLMLGVRTAKDLRAVADAVGSEAMAHAIRSLAPYEVRRILENIDPSLAGSAPMPDEARRRLANLVSVALDTPADEPAVDLTAIVPAQPLRRHRALGARRIRLVSE